MKIWTQLEDGSLGLGAARCDRCLHTVSAHRPGDDVSEMQEFFHAEIVAGPGARHFTHGDTLVADLCEKCAHELLAPCLRRVVSASGEIDFPFINLDALGFDPPDGGAPPKPDRH